MLHVVYIFIFRYCHLSRERDEQRQVKQAAADQSKPKREATADPALPNQHAHTSPAVLATDVEDSKLPGFAKQPPPADPIGRGLLSPQQLSGAAHLGSQQHAVVPRDHMSIAQHLDCHDILKSSAALVGTQDNPAVSTTVYFALLTTRWVFETAHLCLFFHQLYHAVIDKKTKNGLGVSSALGRQDTMLIQCWCAAGFLHSFPAKLMS